MPPNKRTTPTTGTGNLESSGTRTPDDSGPEDTAGRTRQDPGPNLLEGAAKPSSLDVAADNAPEHPEGATTPDTDGPGYSDEHQYRTPWGLRVLHPDQVDQLRKDYPSFEIVPVTSVDDPSEVVHPEAEARRSAELATGERIADTPAVRAAQLGDEIHAGRDPRESNGTPSQTTTPEG